MQARDQVDAEAVFASRLRDTREAAGLSQARFAALLAEQSGIDLDPTAITRVERGQRRIGLGEAQAMAGVLGVTLEYLSKAGPAPVATRLERHMMEAKAMLAHYEEMATTAAAGAAEAAALIAELEARLDAAQRADKDGVQQLTGHREPVIVGAAEYFDARRVG